jgi:hypothetical protein
MTEAQLHAYILTEASEYLVWNDFVKCLDMNVELLKLSLGKVQWVWKLSTESKGGDNCDIMYMNSSNFYAQW